MSIQMIGIDHGRAPIDVREKFSFTKKACGETYESLRDFEKLGGIVILSTCNRTEVWVDTEDDEDFPMEQWLCDLKHLKLSDFQDYLIVRRGAEAVDHLFHMTSGLKSLIVGEDQILSQVRDAWTLAREWEATNKVLDVLFRMAVTGAKQVKSNMQISTADTSAIEHALRYLKAKGVSFAGKTCMVIGNGEMGKRTALALTAEGADVTVTIRQYKSGVVEIPRGCKRINYGDRMEYLPKCDFIVSATSSPNTTIKYEELKELSLDKPQIYIDLAVPRDIETEIRSLPGVTLYDIDQFPATMGTEELNACLSLAEEILEKQKVEFFTWYECRDMVPRAKAIGEKSGKDLYWRMGKALRKMSLTEEQNAELEKAVEDAAEKVIQKLLFALRDEAGTETFRNCLQIMERIYEK